MVKAVHCWKAISKRPTGRPKPRWADDVKKGIQKLKVSNWKTLVQDIRRWNKLVEKGKILHLTLCRLMSYKSYRTANLQMLHFKYLFNKCPY
jgi:hypothetical protein